MDKSILHDNYLADILTILHLKQQLHITFETVDIPRPVARLKFEAEM